MLAGSCRADGFALYFIASAQCAWHITFSLSHHAQARHWLAVAYPHMDLDRQAPARVDLQAGFLAYWEGRAQLPALLAESPFLARATAFQQRVWQLIAAIPSGSTATYSDLAARLGNRKLARAVGAACGANPVALVIPCHRVVGMNGLGGFAGGLEVKRRLLAREAITP